MEGLDSNDTAPLFEIPVVQQEGEAGDRGGSVRNRQPYTICKYSENLAAITEKSKEQISDQCLTIHCGKKKCNIVFGKELLL